MLDKLLIVSFSQTCNWSFPVTDTCRVNEHVDTRRGAERVHLSTYTLICMVPVSVHPLTFYLPWGHAVNPSSCQQLWSGPLHLWHLSRSAGLLTIWEPQCDRYTRAQSQTHCPDRNTPSQSGSSWDLDLELRNLWGYGSVELGSCHSPIPEQAQTSLSCV